MTPPGRWQDRLDAIVVRAANTDFRCATVLVVARGAVGRLVAMAWALAF